ncbi:MAG: DUF6316 family protein [Alcanivorax sp.]|jgi:hypothetical protein|uniref:DUF6316 family protein n=1 Tax=Alcanivorax sp. TaxID=1872427 RepID=UPI0019C6880A|nr:DUF6316 family protein [Alcanivorax sp.]MBD3643620.1 hypothetical protein [Alcanivorax sp.]MDF1723913.1 DUF6316 family protein [Alcanivorax sp.]
MNRRKEDLTTCTRFRSDRFFTEGSQWYFATRENTVEGPFISREEAENGLMLYLRDIQAKESFGLKPARAPGNPVIRQ